MDNFTSRKLINKIEYALKEVVNDVLNTTDNIDDFEQMITKKVNAKIRGLSRSLSFSFPIPNDIEVKDISYEPKTASNGIIKGEIIIEHCEKRNPYKYGEPGYPGKEDGQLCEYPKHSGTFYKWKEGLCRWEDLYPEIDRSNDEQSWYDKLTNNAAFEPWWGSNTSGGNYLRSDRKRNGADDLWGDPGVRSYMGTFKQISADVMQSIYRFTLNLKSAIGHYDKLGTAFGFGDEENTSDSSNDIYTVEEEPKVTIIIEKINHWSYFYNNGRIDQSGSLTRKDSIIYVKDSSSVRERILEKNNAVKKDAYERFKKNN